MTTAQLETRRRAALDRANEIRAHRADLKLDLADGHTTLAAILREDDERIATMRVRDLLLALPALGATKVRRALAANRMTSLTTVGGINAGRRDELLAWLLDHHRAAMEAIGAESHFDRHPPTRPERNHPQ